MAKEIWVFAEVSGGIIASVTKELLAASQKLAEEMGVYTVAAVLAGKENNSFTEELGNCGAEKVYSLEHEGLEHYRSDFYGCALAQLIKTFNPEYFLLGATAVGSELAPTSGRSSGNRSCGTLHRSQMERRKTELYGSRIRRQGGQ